jgi:hypothetical protein
MCELQRTLEIRARANDILGVEREAAEIVERDRLPARVAGLMEIAERFGECTFGGAELSRFGADGTEVLQRDAPDARVRATGEERLEFGDRYVELTETDQDVGLRDDRLGETLGELRAASDILSLARHSYALLPVASRAMDIGEMRQRFGARFRVDGCARCLAVRFKRALECTNSLRAHAFCN